MKKIVILSNMYPTKNHPTFGIFVKNQVQQLKSAGQNIEVIAIDEPGKGKVLTLKKYLSWFMKSMFFLLKHKKNISLTHAHYAFPTGLLSLIGKKVFKIPYIVTVHGGDIDKMAGKHPKIKQLTARILKDADHVIAVGERLKFDIVHDFHVPKNRVEVLSMGVDTSIFKYAQQADARKSIGLDDDGKMILFVGNVIPEKGVLELIDAFGEIKRKFADVSLYILGAQRNQTFSEKVLQLIEREEIKDVHFKQPVNQAELAKWMAASNVLALPSYHEGFGLVALEAMATGTQVVGSDVGGLSYLLQGQAGILVKPKSSSSLAEGLQIALEDKGIDEQQMKKMVHQHSADLILQKLIVIYNDVGR